MQLMKNKTRAPWLWEMMTVEEIRTVLKKTKTALLPLGVTEQHGYHLPLCTDTLNAREIATQVSARTGAVVAPALPYSFSGGELPGTLNVSPQVTALMVQEIVRAIVQNGFKQVVIVLGHGGAENFLALKDALGLLLRNHPHWSDVVVAFAPIWEFGRIFKEKHRRGDFHAGEVETSMLLYLAPAMVRKRIVKDAPRLARLQTQHPDNYQLVETLVDSPRVVPRVRQRPDIKVGVMGYPERATTKLGKTIVTETVNGICNLVRKIERSKHTQYRKVNVRRPKVAIFQPE